MIVPYFPVCLINDPGELISIDIYSFSKRHILKLYAFLYEEHPPGTKLYPYVVSVGVIEEWDSKHGLISTFDVSVSDFIVSDNMNVCEFCLFIRNTDSGLPYDENLQYYCMTTDKSKAKEIVVESMDYVPSIHGHEYYPE